MFVKNVSLTRIKPPQFDTRTKIDPEADEELSTSIQQFGVLEPILVKVDGDDFEIVFGHRRYRTCSRLGLATIPCIIVSSDDKELELIKIHENLHRLPNSHVDQGRTFEYLRDKFSMTETEISVLVGKSIAYVSQHLSLLASDPEIIEAVHTDKINFSAARELVKVKDAGDRKRLLNVVKDSGASTAVIHSWAKESNRDLEPDDKYIKYVPEDNSPPYQNNPTFPCQCCNQIIPISRLVIVRLCPECDFQFKTAIKDIQESDPSNDTAKT